MLPQFGLTEFMLVAIVALIVVGPKDLPLMMRKLGQFVAKGRAMAREFQSAFDDIARQAELDELRKEIQDLRRENALTEAVEDLKKVEADINRRVMMENPITGPDERTTPVGVPDDSAPGADTTSGSPEPATVKPVERIGPDGTPAPQETSPDDAEGPDARKAPTS